MKRNQTEAKVLKKLGIQDFRHMTKDKVMSFVSLYPYMDPEVAKKALEQFPAFTETALAITRLLKENIDEAIGANSANMAEFNEACRSMLDALEEELHKEEITAEEKKNIIEHMSQVLDLMYRKDTENKEFLRDIIKCLAVLGFGTVLALAAALGVVVSANWNDKKS